MDNSNKINTKYIDVRFYACYNIIKERKGINMTHTNITNFRKNIYNLLEQTIKYNEPLNISTKSGNAVVLSEEDYKNLIATLEIESNKELKERIVEGMQEDLKDCISESEVDW